MAWIRLDDDYIHHPKFTRLSDRAFRLWHEGMCFCRKLMTDGLIRLSELKSFRYATPKAVQELTSQRDQAKALWVTDPEGYRVHDYLDWNPSRHEERQDRDAAKHRMRAYRGKAVTPRVTPSVTPNVTPHVPGEGKGSGSFLEKGSGEKPATTLEPDEIAERAGRLVDRYGELYAEHRRGARHRARPNLDWMEACSLVPLWDDARLEKLAVIVLKTDDPWISKTDRSFKIFAMKATWADDRLKEWEEANGVTV